MSMTRLMWMLLLLAAPAWAADWERLLADRLPFYGHRNWIVIADSAYPAQARDGIETIVVNVDQVRVLRHVLSMLDASGYWPLQSKGGGFFAKPRGAFPAP
jgi:L-fucose mutarotase/ribose pyranase (RbsD/FucU family)